MQLKLEVEGTPLDELGELTAEENPEGEASGFVDEEVAEVEVATRLFCEGGDNSVEGLEER